jgi:hypothetical protein
MPEELVCDQNDPSSECYRPPVVTKKTCPETQYLDEQTNQCVFLQIYFGSFNEIFDVKVLTTDSNDPKSSRRTLKAGVRQKLVSVSDKEFVMQLEFTDPLEVTPND